MHAPFQVLDTYTVFDRSKVGMQALFAYPVRGGFYHQFVAIRADGIANTTLVLYVKEVAQYFAETAANYKAYRCLLLPMQLNVMSLPLQDQNTTQLMCHQTRV
jgi:hypothetical protein